MTLALAIALVHFLWQGALLGVVFLLGWPLLRRAAAPVRYAVTFGALLSTPLLVASTVARLLGAPATMSGTVGLPAPTPAWGWAHAVVALWIAGMLARGGSSAFAWVGLQRLRATGLPLRPWIDPLRRLARELDVRRAVALVESPAVTTPILVGWVRPMIMLPLGLATSLPPECLQAVLAHELAHVRRHDYALGLLQRAIEILLFFHPVVWWLSARVSEAREQCCDALVVDTLRAPLPYAQALVAVAAHRPPALAVGATPQRGALMSRIESIVFRSPRPVPRHAGLAQGLLALGVVVGIACVTHDGPAAETDVAAPEATRIADEAPSTPGTLAATPPATADDGLSIAWLPEAVTDFEAEIVAAGRHHGIDPDLLAIVVLVESGGRPDARSPIGARGLMQVMPATAEQIAAARAIEDHDASRLDDPGYNLDFGAWYLARQLETFGTGRDEGDSISLAAAAYNGGPDRLERALQGQGELTDEATRYAEIVSALWAERDADQSPTLSRD